MPLFRYQASEEGGGKAAGEVVAESLRGARDELRRRGWVVWGGREVGASGATAYATKGRRGPSPGLEDSTTLSPGERVQIKRGRKIPGSQWSQMILELSTLLAGGIPLLEAMKTLAAEQTPRVRSILIRVQEQIAGGMPLSEAIRLEGVVDDDLSIQLIRVGEETGHLDETLSQLAAFQQRWLLLKDQVTSALIYPLFVLAFGLAAAVFLMTWVMPMLLESLTETLTVLPWPTRVVKAGSDVLVGYWPVLLGVVVLVVVLWTSVNRMAVFQKWRDRFVLDVPLLGKLILKQSLSRAGMIIALCMRTGLTLVDAMELVANSLPNRAIQQAFRDGHEAIQSGKSLSEALAETGVFPALAIQVFSVGQESGQLPEMLDRMVEDYDRQVEMASRRLASLVEPVLILFLAVMIGFLILAVILPILEAGNAAMK